MMLCLSFFFFVCCVESLRPGHLAPQILPYLIVTVYSQHYLCKNCAYCIAFLAEHIFFTNKGALFLCILTTKTVLSSVGTPSVFANTAATAHLAHVLQ